MGTQKKNELISAYLEKRAALHRFLVARFRNEAIAEDILQEMYLKLERTPSIGPISNVSAYLFKVANNLALDHRRQHQRSAARDKSWSDVNKTSIGDQSVDETVGAERALAAKQKLEKVGKVLDELPPQCRKVFILHKLQGLSHKEVSQNLGISTSTVEKHMSKALKFLVLQFKEAD